MHEKWIGLLSLVITVSAKKLMKLTVTIDDLVVPVFLYMLSQENDEREVSN